MPLLFLHCTASCCQLHVLARPSRGPAQIASHPDVSAAAPVPAAVACSSVQPNRKVEGETPKGTIQYHASSFCDLQVNDGGIVITLVDAIRKHFQDKPVVATTCGLLRHLAKSDDIKKLLMGQDTLPVLTSVLDEHKGKAEVCAQVCLLVI